MNNLEFKGSISAILPVATGESQKGEWKSIDFVVKETSGDYPQSASFRLFGIDKVENFIKYNNVGDAVTVSFNLKSREYQGKHYTSLDAWKVFKDNAVQSNAPLDSIEEEDDLPF